MSNIASLTSQIANLEQRIASLETKFASLGNSVNAAETRIQSSVAQSNNTLNSFWANIQSGATRAGAAFTAGSTTIVTGSNNINQALQLTNQATQQSVVQINELGIAGSRLASSFSGPGGALAQFNSQLGQVSGGLGRAGAAMDSTQRSGNRLAEIFRGNRGLVFGFSALFGTITGIAFELQLVNDANMQVAESQAALNELVRQGKEGTAQYSQAQQALGKDQRFLEFSTRNLALAFTNLIPDILLIINGMLSLRDKIGGVTAAGGFPALTRGAGAAATELERVGVAAATSATPLGRLGVVGRSVGEGFGIAAGTTLSLRATLLGVGAAAATLIAVFAGAGFLISEVFKQFDAAKEAGNSLDELINKQSDLANSTNGVNSAINKSNDIAKSSTKDLVDSMITQYDRWVQSSSTMAASVKKNIESVVPLNPPTLPPNVGGAGTPTTGGTMITPEQAEQFSKALTPKERLGPFRPGETNATEPLGPPLPPAIQQQRELDRRLAQNDVDAQRLLTQARAPGGRFQNFPAELPLSIDDLAQADSLLKSLNEQLAKKPSEQDPLKIVQLAKEYNDLVTGKTALNKETEKELTLAEKQRNAFESLTKAQEGYNKYVEAQPRILQETGQLTKIVTQQRQIEVNALTAAAAAYVDYGATQLDANTITKAQEGVLKGIVAEGKRVVDSLYEQRDAVQGANIFWQNMNATTRQQIQITQEQIIASIDVIRAIKDQTYQQYLVNQGYIQGKLAVAAWVDSLYQSTAAEETEHELLEAIVGTFMKLPPALTLTTQDLRALGEEFARTGDNAATMDAIMNKTFASSRQALSDLVGAAVQGGDEWKNAWKDLDKSFIPKGEFGEVKDFINDLADIQTAAANVAGPLGIFMGLLEAGRISGKENSKWTKELTEGMRGMRDALGAIVGMGVAENIFDPLIKFKKDGLTQNEVQIWAAVANEYQRLSELPGVWTDERTRQLSAYTQKLLDQKEAYEQLQKAADKAEKSVKNVHSVTILGSGSGVQIKPDKPIKGGPEADLPGLGELGIKLLSRPDDQKKGSDPAAAATKQQVEANNQLAITLNQIKINTEALTKANNVYAKTVVQVYKDVILQTAGNNVLDSTIAQIIIDTGLWVKSNNLLDRTVAQLIKDINLYVKANNIYDRTVAQIITDTDLWVKSNNILDRTVAQLITDEGLLTKTTNALTKATQASDKAFDNAASAASDYAKQLKKVESQARATAKAIASIPSGGGGSSAQGGMHTNLTEDTVILAHANERVDIGPGTQDGNIQSRARGRGGGGGDTIIHLTEHNHIILNGEEIEVQTNRKTFKRLNSR